MHYYSQFPLEQTEAWRRWGVTQPVCRRAEIHTDALLVPEGSMQITPCPVLPWRQHLMGITLCTHRGEDSPCLIYSWETDTWERRNTNPCHLDIRQLDRDLKLNSDSRYCESSKALQCHASCPSLMFREYRDFKQPNRWPHFIGSRSFFCFHLQLLWTGDASMCEKAAHLLAASVKCALALTVNRRDHDNQKQLKGKRKKILAHRDSCPPCPLLRG